MTSTDQRLYVHPIIQSKEKRTHIGIRQFDVVALHGLVGSRETTWTTRNHGKRVMWLTDLIPSRLNNPRIMTFDYRILGEQGISETDISRISDQLLEALFRKRGSDVKRSIVFIGHGLGGIIIKKALLTAIETGKYTSIAAATSLLVFFGTPHRGHDRNSWYRIACNLHSASGHSQNGAVLQVIQKTSRALAAVSDEFQMIAKLYKMINCFENGNASPPAPVFDKYSTTFDLSNEIAVGLDRSHFHLAKLGDGRDEVFRKVCAEIDSTSGPSREYITFLRTLASLNSKAYRPRLQQDHNPETFAWLDTNEAFKLWLDGKTGADRILWVHGRQGSGSSTLASWAIELAQKSPGNSDLNAVILFSFDSKDERYSSTYNMFASLTHQLLCLRPELFEHVRLFAYQVMNCKNDGSHIKVAQLWTLFRSLLSCPHHGETYCVIDAIDECDKSRNRFLQELLQLPNCTNSTFRLVVSSATESGQYTNVSSAHRIDLDAIAGREKDIEIVLQTHTSDLIKRRPQYRKAVTEISQILRDSSSTLPVSLLTLTFLDVLDIRSSQSAVREALQSQSKIVPNLFQRFLGENPQRTSDWALRALAWIINVKRPLTLSEISVAIAIKHDKEKGTFFYSEDEVLMDPASDLQRSFGGLIKIRNKEVSLAHRSLEKFLKQKHNLYCKSTTEECPLCSDWHLVMARSCLSYLSMLSAPHSQQRQGGLQGGSADLGELTQGRSTPPLDSLQAYAVQYWPSHYRSAKINPAELEQFQNLFKNDDLTEMWSRLFKTYQDPSIDGCVRDSLSVASEVGCEALVNILLEKSIGDPSTALKSAIEAGQESLIDPLLGHGAFQPLAISIGAAHARDKIVFRFIKKGYSISEPDELGMTPLHIASECGSSTIVDTLLNKDSIAVDARNWEGFTALHLASRCGHTDVMRNLLEKNANAGAVSNDGSTPMHLACKWQQPGAVETLLQWNAEVDNVDDCKVTPLHMAADTGRVDIVNMLFEHLPSSTERHELIRSRDAQGLTPLHSAAAAGHSEVVEELLSQTSESHVLTTMKDGQSRVPLHCAARNGHLDVVKALLRISSDQLGETDDSSSNPIHLAVAGGHDRIVGLLCFEHKRIHKPLDVFNSSKLTPLHLACDVGNTNMVRFLLTAGAAAEIAGENNRTPLHLACAGGFLDIAELLMAFSANPMARNSDGYTPLHLASEAGHLDVVQELVRRADEALNATDNSGRTPIHLAARGGHEEVMKVLGWHGADWEAKDDMNSTLLHFACEGGSIEAVRSLLNPDGITGGSVDDKNKLGQTPLHTAAKADRLDVVQELITRGANPTAMDNAKHTPLELASDARVIKELWDLTVQTFDSLKLIELIHKSASQGHKEVLERLLKIGSMPNAIDDDRKTPLILAAHNGHLEVVRLLLGAKDIEPEQKDKRGRAPLSYAAEHGHEAVVSELLRSGHDKDSLDNSGRAPISYAAEKGHDSVIEHLIKSSAQIDPKEKNVSTPIWYAAKRGHSKTVKLLLQHGADPNVVGDEGKTALHLAAKKDYWETAKVLLDSKTFTKGDWKDDDDSTSMYIAAYHGHVKTMGVLLAAKLGKEIPGPNRWRPLHAAFDSLPITRLLLNAKVEIDSVTSGGMTALSLAIYGRYDDVAEELLESGADPLIADEDGDTALHLVAQHGSGTRLFHLLLERTSSRDGFDVNVRNKKGWSPLWRAIAGGHAEIAEALLQRNDVNIHVVDNEKHSPLWGGIDNGRLKTVEMLLRRMDEERWKALSTEGETPEALLLHAARQDNEKMFDMVWKSVNSVIDSTDEGLFKLAMDDDSKLASFLLRSNADPVKTDEHGWTLGWLVFSYQIGDIPSGIKLQELPDTQFVPPTSWSEHDKSENIMLDVEKDSESTEKVIVYTGHTRAAPELEESSLRPRSPWLSFGYRYRVQREGVLANHPIPPKEIFYFEVKVLSQASGSIVGIGCCTKDSDLNRMPGWDGSSWGYHGDDGGLYHDSGSPLRHGDEFGPGDIVGCGVNASEKSVFFTKNGQLLDATLKDARGRLYPTIRIKNSAVVKANFTGKKEPFRYNIGGHRRQSEEAIPKYLQSLEGA